MSVGRARVESGLDRRTVFLTTHYLEEADALSLWWAPPVWSPGRWPSSSVASSSGARPSSWRSCSSTCWTARWYAELLKLAGTTDPAAFAQASKHTPFGAIDVFVLRRSRGDLVWQPLRRPREVRFTREQFDPADFVTIEPLQNNTVVVIRLPGH